MSREDLARIASRRPVAIALVGCGKSKASEPRPACELYTGSLFRAAYAHAVATSDRVFIVSAKHGLLRPDEVVEPYEHKLRFRESFAWARVVVDQLHREIGHVRRQISVFAGGTYSDALGFVLCGDIIDHCAGMTLGQRLAFFAQKRRERELVAAYLAAGGEGLQRGQLELFARAS